MEYFGSCCGTASSNGIDDVAYFEDMVSIVTSTYGGDSNRIFGYGISNGGFLMHRIACTSSFLAKGADFIGSHLQKVLYDARDESAPCLTWLGEEQYEYNGDACPYETWKAFPDYYTCDTFQENRPDFLQISGTRDEIIKYNGDGWMTAPQEFSRRLFSELAECDYDSMTITQSFTSTDYCMSDTSCETNLKFCDAEAGHGGGFSFDPVQIAFEFFCADGGCDPMQIGNASFPMFNLFLMLFISVSKGTLY